MKKREVSLFVLLAIVLLPFITGCYKREMPDDIKFLNSDGSYFSANPILDGSGKLIALKKIGKVNNYYSAMDGFITFYELTPASIKTVWQFREWKKVKYTIDDGDLILYYCCPVKV